MACGRKGFGMKRNQNHIVVDSSGLIYSAFYTFGTLSYDKKPTGVIYGFLKKVLTLAEKFNTNNFYFCFDHMINHREQLDPRYKANRKDKKDKWTAEDMEQFTSKVKQEKEIREFALKKMGFRNLFRQEGYEGDDFMALLCEKLQSKKILLVSADADMYQCLEHCDIIHPSSMKTFTKKDFEEKYKVHPSQWPICKSIGGCSGDNVIGIEGASDPKNASSKALKYVRKELTSGVIYDKIVSEQGKQTIRKNLRLVKLPFMPEDIRNTILRRNKYNKMGFIEVFSKYSFKSFLERDNFKKWEDQFLFLGE
jgi:5'-3' exonuclease